MAALTSNGGVPWDQTADYVALTQRSVPAGGRQTYTRPHPVGLTPTDITSFVYGQADVHIDNWPDVMYMLYPPQEFKTFRQGPKPLPKRDANGVVVREKWPCLGQAVRPLRAFDVLPDTISSSEEWFWFDLWRRIDPRMSWEDITMRIEQPAGTVRTAESDHKFVNATQNMVRRVWHSKYYILSWFGTGTRHNKARAHVLAGLSREGIPVAQNTTRGLTPGLVDPANGPNSERIPHPDVKGNIGRGRRRQLVQASTTVTGAATTASRKRKRPRKSVGDSEDNPISLFSDDEDQGDSNNTDNGETHSDEDLAKAAYDSDEGSAGAASDSDEDFAGATSDSQRDQEYPSGIGEDSDHGGQEEMGQSDISEHEGSTDDGQDQENARDLEFLATEGSADGGQGREDRQESEDAGSLRGNEEHSPSGRTTPGMGNDSLEGLPDSHGHKPRISLARKHQRQFSDSDLLLDLGSPKPRFSPSLDFDINFKPVNHMAQGLQHHAVIESGDPRKKTTKVTPKPTLSFPLTRVPLPTNLLSSPTYEHTPSPTETPGLGDHSPQFVDSGALDHLRNPAIDDHDDSSETKLESLLDE